MGMVMSCPCYGEFVEPVVLQSCCYKCNQGCSTKRQDLFLVKIIHWGKSNGKIICSDCLYLT